MRPRAKSSSDCYYLEISRGRCSKIATTTNCVTDSLLVLSSRVMRQPMAVDSPASEQHKYLSDAERKVTYDIRKVGEDKKNA